jgi:hypothetical protein
MSICGLESHPSQFVDGSRNSLFVAVNDKSSALKTSWTAYSLFKTSRSKDDITAAENCRIFLFAMSFARSA